MKTLMVTSRQDGGPGGPAHWIGGIALRAEHTVACQRINVGSRKWTLLHVGITLHLPTAQIVSNDEDDVGSVLSYGWPTVPEEHHPTAGKSAPCYVSHDGMRLL